jgi:hypothetical protein
MSDGAGGLMASGLGYLDPVEEQGLPTAAGDSVMRRYVTS